MTWREQQPPGPSARPGPGPAPRPPAQADAEPGQHHGESREVGVEAQGRDADAQPALMGLRNLL